MNLTPDSNVLIQGITQPLGSYYAARMKAYGTNLVAGVSVGHGGQQVHDIPVFDLVEQAISETGSVDTTIIFVKSYRALDAALEAIDAGISQIILVTGGIPPLDMVRLLRKAQATDTVIVGPSSSGIIVPGKLLLGTQESEFYTPGSVGLISRVGPLTYEVALTLTQAKLGQSMGVNLGSDPIVGSSFHRWLQVLATDKDTKAIVLVDKTGGSSEEATADYITKAINKPVVVYIAGYYTPEDKQLGDASAIIAAQLSGPVTSATTAQHKIEAFKQAKVPVAERLSQIPDLVKKALKNG
ncbi:succinate--CoA ligase subunit alpha [Coleofasciculus sp. LEGE 07081]|uniref:succinate--CoA ligase subunit alpha n=1 Tax=unclassified Coleofasciculus TaxID=2692782 RepID=UPI00187EF03F|nr:CoA-binding protein [Coleofasciculus sp. LEGE 07081]MBE9150926.1 CoA-binding protein [Coleofasciculus sp. LEGE 07092]